MSNLHSHQQLKMKPASLQCCLPLCGAVLHLCGVTLRLQHQKSSNKWLETITTKLSENLQREKKEKKLANTPNENQHPSANTHRLPAANTQPPIHANTQIRTYSPILAPIPSAHTPHTTNNDHPVRPNLSPSYVTKLWCLCCYRIMNEIMNMSLT